MKQILLAKLGSVEGQLPVCYLGLLLVSTRLSADDCQVLAELEHGHQSCYPVLVEYYQLFHLNLMNGVTFRERQKRGAKSRRCLLLLCWQLFTSYIGSEKLQNFCWKTNEKS